MKMDLRSFWMRRGACSRNSVQISAVSFRETTMFGLLDDRLRATQGVLRHEIREADIFERRRP